MVVGGLPGLYQPGLEQCCKELSLNGVLRVLLHSKALVVPAQVTQLEGHMSAGVPGECHRKEIGLFYSKESS